jgi:hypothetical protein
MTDDGVDGEVGLCQPNMVRCAVQIATHIVSVQFELLTLKTSKEATVWTLGCL